MPQETVRIKDADNPHGRDINRADFDPKVHEYFSHDTPPAKKTRAPAKAGKRRPGKRAVKAAATTRKAAPKAPKASKAADTSPKDE